MRCEECGTDDETLVATITMLVPDRKKPIKAVLCRDCKDDIEIVMSYVRRQLEKDDEAS